MDHASRLKRALATRDAALALLRLKGEWMARGDIPFLMMMEPELTLALRTPFQRLPKESERAKYMRALEGGRTSLPYGLEIWAPKKVLNIEWNDVGSVELIGYEPGEWEWRIKAAAAQGQT